MQVLCLDMEGVLVPEIWIEFSKRTGIAEFSRTTRDEPDYDKLMRYRLGLLDQHGCGCPTSSRSSTAWARWPARASSSTTCARASR